MTKLRLAIIGPGKMGTAIADLARSSGSDVVATIAAGTTINRESLLGADVAIEFTEPAAAPANIRACVLAGCAVVVGTTGWYDQLAPIESLVIEHNGALLWASNFSLGVHALTRLIARAGEIFSALPGFDAELVETHHATKKDSPSGTARMLQETFVAGWGRDLPIASIRLGSVPGTHALIIDGAFEQIVISHEARDRRVFAEGALVAARWLVGRRGVFTLDDVLSRKEIR
ncbi:MAG: dihydrodipicolinate reductase C-terminal domain-containing protein [Gemmatimonadaceae bacterium]